MKTITVSTGKKREIKDITALVAKSLQGSDGTGLCHLFLTHTTAALTIADLDPGTDLDMLDAFEEIVPRLNYRHPHNPAHLPDHVLSSLIGVSLLVPWRRGELILGTWQRVILVELDGPRQREIVISLIPERQ
ncbi:MAG TPA: secondary thiamine-phosphate synthase enzyme YjbQ [Candidatus Eisenbacteria bacterium]|nr:secondary thiamine-phosphate synthase enzyme YjbQ [Candidatus Eisenbacteria bacterium]